MSELSSSKQRQPGRVRARARLRQKSQITLPEEIRHALRVREGDELEFTVNQDGSITVRGFVSIPSDQVWLYASAQPGGTGAGQGGSVHESASAMFAHLIALGSSDVG